MKEDYIRRKERWAQKISGKELPTRPNVGRLPAGQHEVNNFPVLDLGEHPEIPLNEWSLKVHGKVENPVTLNWEQFNKGIRGISGEGNTRDPLVRNQILQIRDFRACCLRRLDK